jgi:hypothetical protein
MGGVKKVKTGIKKLKTEGGAGGGRGHSNMDHWGHTDEIKSAAKSRRRIEGKLNSSTGVAEYLAEKSPAVSRGKNEK